MSEKNNEWDNVAFEYEKVFGKMPRKNMKVATMKKKIDAHAEPDEVTDSPKTKFIQDKMNDLLVAAREVAENGEPTMVCLIMGEKGIHMLLSGQGQEAAIMVATAIVSEPKMGAVLGNGAVMARMRMNNVAQEANFDEDGNELAPAGMPEAQTKA